MVLTNDCSTYFSYRIAILVAGLLTLVAGLLTLVAGLLTLFTGLLF